MPMVDGKKFPYTKAGIAAAKKANAKHEKSEGKKEQMVEYGKKVTKSKTAGKKKPNSFALFLAKVKGKKSAPKKK